MKKKKFSTELIGASVITLFGVVIFVVATIVDSMEAQVLGALITVAGGIFVGLELLNMDKK